MDMDTVTNHVEVQTLILRPAVCRDEVHIHPHLQPKDDLVMKFRTRTAITAGESIDKNTFQRRSHNKKGNNPVKNQFYP